MANPEPDLHVLATDLTLADSKNAGRRKEICGAREIVCDFLDGDNVYAFTAEAIDHYFTSFAVAARRNVAR